MDCAGQSFILYNDAPSPFPEGDEADYHTGNGGAPDSTHGPNTRTLMRIRITSAGGGQTMTDDRLLAAVTTELARNQLGLLVDDATIGTVFEAPDFYTRRTRTLNEGWDPYGRLVQILGTGSPSGKDGTVYGMHYTDGLREEESTPQWQTRGLGHLQHDRRHTPDPLPPGQRPDPGPRPVCAGR